MTNHPSSLQEKIEQTGTMPQAHKTIACMCYTREPAELQAPLLARVRGGGGGGGGGGIMSNILAGSSCFIASDGVAEVMWNS